jgi:hypothetical protein
VNFIEREGHVEVDKVKKVCKSFEGVELVDYSYNVRILTRISPRRFFPFLRTRSLFSEAVCV